MELCGKNPGDRRNLATVIEFSTYKSRFIQLETYPP